jgi:hypothetical protein
MIVNIRIAVTDEIRNRLAIINNPNAPKRLANRKEFCDLVDGVIAGLQENAPAAPQAAARQAGRPTLAQLINRARSEDPEALRGRSDSLARGWA